MNKTVFFAAASAIAALTGICSPAESAAKVQELLKRHGMSCVTVRWWFKSDADSLARETGFPYKCPNCDNIHTRDLEDYLDESRPLETVGYAVETDSVIAPDINVHADWLDKIEIVSSSGATASAKPDLRYPNNGSVLLRSEKPLDGVVPLSFERTPPDAKGLQFFYCAKEDGIVKAEVKGAGALSFCHYPQAGITYIQGKANTVLVRQDGAPATLWMEESLPWSPTAVNPPQDWASEPFTAQGERYARLIEKLSASIIPVHIKLETQTETEGRRRSRIVFSSSDIEGPEDEKDVLGIVLESGELLVPAQFTAHEVASIESAEASLPCADGAKAPLEFVGKLRNEGLFIFKFSGDENGARRPSPAAIGKKTASELFANKLWVGAVQNRLDGTAKFLLMPERLTSYHTSRKGRIEATPNYFNVKEGNGFDFATDENGAIAILNTKSKSGSHSSREAYSGAELANMLARRDYDPEYAIRKGKDRIRTGWIGVEAQNVTAEIAYEKKATPFLKVGFRSSGALVTKVFPGSPADLAGVKEGDILTFVRNKSGGDREPLRGEEGSSRDWESIYQRAKPEMWGYYAAAPWPDVASEFNSTFTECGIGSEVVVGCVTDGKLRELEMTVEQAPTYFATAKTKTFKGCGLSVCDLTFEVKSFYQLGENDGGVVVSKVKPGGPAAVAGILPTELVLKVDDAPVADSAAFAEAVKDKEEVSLTVRRLATTRIVRLKLKSPN